MCCIDRAHAPAFSDHDSDMYAAQHVIAPEHVQHIVHKLL